MNNLTTEQKSVIRETLQGYIESYGSQNKAASSLGVAAATLSAINNGDFSKISDEMWLKIATRIGGGTHNKSAIVETSVTKDLIAHMDDTRKDKDFQWAISPAGSGKTIAAKIARQQSNTYYILCDEDMTKKDFALEFARSAGLDVNRSKSARSIVLECVEHMRKRKDVLLIFDEADKLSDRVLNYFITIYNYFEDLEGNSTVGIQAFSTDYIKTRVERGLRYKKRGSQEFWSRIGSMYYHTDKITAFDVEAICRARGVIAKRDIDIVVKGAEAADFDLRRVARMVKAILRKNTQQVV